MHPPKGAKFRIIDDATRREIPPSCPGSSVATSARTGQDVRDDAPGERTTIADRVVRPSDRHPERFAGLNIPISGRTWQSGGISLPAERFAPSGGCTPLGLLQNFEQPHRLPLTPVAHAESFGDVEQRSARAGDDDFERRRLDDARSLHVHVQRSRQSMHQRRAAPLRFSIRPTKCARTPGAADACGEYARRYSLCCRHHRFNANATP